MGRISMTIPLPITNIHSNKVQDLVLELCKGCEKVPLLTVYPDGDPDLLHLINGLMEYDTKRRLTAAQALKSPYFVGIRDSGDEPNVTALFDFNFEFCTPEQLGGE
jgi:serine/threonine protein kinase